MIEWLKTLKLWTDGKKTITAVLSLTLAALQNIDVGLLVALNPAEWGKITIIALLGVLGVYGYEDAKNRIRQEVSK